MKVSGIYPVFTFNDIESVVEGNKAIGFKTVHHLKETDQVEIYVMETANGSRLDILKIAGAKDGQAGIRINVDNLDEAVRFYKDNSGFTGGDKVFETATNKITEMHAPNNDSLYILVEHKKG